jgi:hypothetical protein
MNHDLEKRLKAIRLEIADVIIVLNSAQKKLAERLNDVHRIELALRGDAPNEIHVAGGCVVYDPSLEKGEEE